MPVYRQFKSNNGFTLAEVLIALVLLGVVAAFTIPKILMSHQQAREKAVFKETLAALYDISTQGRLTGELTRNNAISYYLQSLNAVKTCNFSISQGCDPNAAEDAPGVILHNGVSISDIDGIYGDWANTHPGEWAMNVEVDLNGPSGPNIFGIDRLDLICSVGSQALSGGYNGLIPGKCVSFGGASDSRFMELLQ